MSFFNDKLSDALFSHEYFCSKCGGKMEFEDQYEDVLVCLSCGHSVDLDEYGLEDENQYDKLYPTEDDFL